MKAYTFALTIAIFLFVPNAANAQNTELKVLTPVVITIDDSTGTGQALVRLRNVSKAEKNVYLTVSIPGPKGSSAKFFFAESPGQKQGVEDYDSTIQGEQEKNVWLYAVNVWDPGDIDVDLNNETALLTKVRMKRSPFNIKFDGATPDKADVALIDGQSFPIRVKNDDARPYTLTWNLLMNGTDVCKGHVTLPPEGVGLLNCSPSVGFHPSRIKDLFKPENGEGHLLQLYAIPNGQDVGNGLPVKTLSVSGSMSYFGTFFQQVGGYATIVFFLVLGGLTSLFLSQALPNRLQRLKLEEQIDELAKWTADLSNHVESKLQVLLRLERSQIRDLLDSRKSWSPDFQGVVTLCTQALAHFKVRVGLAREMDIVLRRLANMLPHGLPPQQVDQIDENVRAAAVLLGKTTPSDADMEAAKLALTKAAELVDRVNQPDPAFGQDLAQRAITIKTEIDTKFRNTNETFKRITNEVPRPDTTLRAIANTTTDIPADFYVQVDTAVEKMTLIRDYIVLYDTTAARAKARLEEAENRFIAFLRTDNWHDLCDARLLFREMKDDIYADRIGELLNNDNAVIEADPRVAYHAAPVELRVHFLNPSSNSAAAREEWTCTWNFGDNLEEQGWTVTHYFLVPKPSGRKFLTRLLKRPYSHTFQIEARFEKRTAQAGADVKEFVLNKSLKVRSRAESGALQGRTWTEGLRLAAALLIAVFGLVAGARDQLTKLDILPGLVAVFLVGFGADTIKNLLTPKP